MNNSTTKATFVNYTGKNDRNICLFIYTLMHCMKNIIKTTKILKISDI